MHNSQNKYFRKLKLGKKEYKYSQSLSNLQFYMDLVNVNM